MADTLATQKVFAQFHSILEKNEIEVIADFEKLPIAKCRKLLD